MSEHQRDWNERYRTQDTPWETGVAHEEMKRLFIEYAAAGASVLDTGCGLGTNTQWLAKQGYEVTGIDISHTAIAQAQQKAAELGLTIQYQTLDFLHEWEKLRRFNVVFDCAVFHLFKTPEVRRKFVKTVSQVCDKSAYWIDISCSVDSADEIAAQSGVDAPPRITAREMIEAVEPDFEIIELRRCDFTIKRLAGAATFKAWGSVFRKR
jgi:2-polyprenyl-3-methyl-5-hydroxy-6-metoxy-1,4-benzoquinol methylase